MEDDIRRDDQREDREMEVSVIETHGVESLPIQATAFSFSTGDFIMYSSCFLPFTSSDLFASPHHNDIVGQFLN